MSIGIRSVYRKAADSIFTNDNAYADLGIAFDIAAGQTVLGQFQFYCDGGAGGIQLQIVNSVAVADVKAYMFFDNAFGGSYVSEVYTAFPILNITTPAAGVFSIAGNFSITAAAAVNIKFQGSQNVADAAATSFFAGSWCQVITL